MDPKHASEIMTDLEKSIANTQRALATSRAVLDVLPPGAEQDLARKWVERLELAMAELVQLTARVLPRTIAHELGVLELVLDDLRDDVDALDAAPDPGPASDGGDLVPVSFETPLIRDARTGEVRALEPTELESMHLATESVFQLPRPEIPAEPDPTAPPAPPA